VFRQEWAAVMLKSSQAVSLLEPDRRVFDLLVAKDHYLRQVRERIDFERFRARLVEAYSPNLGRPAVDPVFMLKVLFLGFHYKLSDRQVMERTKTDVAFRWFLDLGMHESVPHHTEGTYFRQRIGVERFQAIFQELVGLAREHGLVKDRLRLKDSTHMIADAAEMTPLALVAQVRNRLLQAAATCWPGWVADERARLETLRQTTAEFADAERLLARVEHLRDLASRLRDQMVALPATSAARRQRLDKALALADKLLADHANPKAGDRLGSAIDPEARTGLHCGYFLGYLLDVATDADSDIITAVNVLPGNGAEAADAIALIQQEEAAHGNNVAGLSIDGAGYNGPVLRELTDPDGLNLEVTVPPPKVPARSTFGPERFALQVLENGVSELTCPAGQTTRQHYRNDKDTGDHYVFTASKCRACPLRQQCLQNPSRKGGRTVIKNDYEVEYQRVAAKAATPEYVQTRREHPQIERKLGELARHQAARRARYRGLGKVLGQALLTALVVNVKRIVKLLSGAAKPPPRTAAARAELQPT
jgi:transposase